MSKPEYTHSKGSILVERGPFNAVPTDNYFSGIGKSIVWMGPAYYVPSSRGWIPYHDYRSLPRETRRDAMYMESEDQWVSFMRNRDTPSGYFHPNIGTLPSGIPRLKLDGYTRDLPNMPQPEVFQHPWPKSDAYVPVDRRPRGGYYGHYHEALEAETVKRNSQLPFSARIGPESIPKL